MVVDKPEKEVVLMVVVVGKSEASEYMIEMALTRILWVTELLVNTMDLVQMVMWKRMVPVC